MTIGSSVVNYPDIRVRLSTARSAHDRTTREHPLRLICRVHQRTAGAVGCPPCSGARPRRSSARLSARRHAAGADAKVTLVVYSAQGYDSRHDQAFTKATGIPVKLDDNSTGPLLTQIEASKNNPNWGLLWVDGATAFAGLDSQGLLLKGFEPRAAGTRSAPSRCPRQELHADRRDPDGRAGLQHDQGARTRPTTWQELLSSQWKGAVGMNDPSQSGPTFPFIAGMMNYLGGVSAGESVLHQAQGQRAGHPPDQRPDPAGADQRPDQAGAGAELGRRSAPRSATRARASST